VEARGYLDLTFLNCSKVFCALKELFARCSMFCVVCVVVVPNAFRLSLITTPHCDRAFFGVSPIL
jgi:hypothetical protein